MDPLVGDPAPRQEERSRDARRWPGGLLDKKKTHVSRSEQFLEKVNVVEPNVVVVKHFVVVPQLYFVRGSVGIKPTA